MAEDSSKIKNKITIAKPHFSLSVETDESLEKAKQAFEELMEKHKK